MAAEQLGSLLLSAGLAATGGGDTASDSKENARSSAGLPRCHVVGFSKGGVVLNQLLAEAAAAMSPSADEAPTLRPPPAPEGAALLRVLRQVHYVDVGLNCRGAYLTDPGAFQQLGRAGLGEAGGRLEIWLHGTPRQWGKEKEPVPRHQHPFAAFVVSSSDVNPKFGLNQWIIRIHFCRLIKGWICLSPAGDPRRPWIKAEKEQMASLAAGAGLLLRERLYFEGEPPSLLMHFRALDAMEVK
jgi:hypothetical protein